MNYILRTAEIEDTVKIAEVAERCAPWVRNSVVGTYEFLARCFRRYFFVIEGDHGQLLGYIVGFPNIDVDREFWLYQVAVLPEVRRNDLGSKLFDALKKKVVEDGYAVMKSHYRFDNEKSKILHAKFGFKPDGTSDERGPFVTCKL
jgi:L-amino acid N-acyltransferase YncA